MATEFTCPYCNATHSLPEGFVGPRAVCVSCRNLVTVTRHAPAAAPAVDDEPEEPTALTMTKSRPQVDSEPIPPSEAPPEDPGAEEDDDWLDEEYEAPFWTPKRLGAGSAGLLVAALAWIAVTRLLAPSPPPPVAKFPSNPRTWIRPTNGPLAATPLTGLSTPLQPLNLPPQPPNLGVQPGLAGAPSSPGPIAPPAANPAVVQAASKPAAPPAIPPTAPPAIPPAAAPAAPPAAPSATPPASAPSLTDLVTRIKEATVYLKVGQGREQSSGTGFVVRVDGNTAYIATNHHVVGMRNAQETEGDETTAASRSSITAVFRSGMPGGREVSRMARVIAYDREGNRDLALLQVDGVPSPPAPIEPSSVSDATETTPVLICGFPFGDLPGMLPGASDPGDHRNPSASTARGSVSRLQYDEAGRLTVVQIDGSINPGNSGGPVVDEKGRLVGLAVAKIANTNIGFAVPASELVRMIAGRVGRVRLGVMSTKGGETVLDVRGAAIDPFSKLRSVELLAGPESPASPDPIAGWAEIPGADRAPLENRAGRLSGTIRVRPTNGRAMSFQICARDESGATIREKPFRYVVPSVPGASTLVVRNPAQGGDDGASSINPGDLVDPSKACKLTKREDGVVLDVPAGVFLLGPDFASRPSPMTLTEVQGDFDMSVQVGGSLLPGLEPAKHKGKSLPNTYQGAGLVVYEDKNNYVWIERGVTVERDRFNGGRGTTTKTEVVVEFRDNGRLQGPFVQHAPEGPLKVRIVRLDGAVRCFFGTNQFVFTLQQLPMRFPDKVRIGLIGSNASKEPLTVRFMDFSLNQENVRERN
ncbi:S1C family serine protease [Paludisphaera rhizosphaerae]|uniref:S1C family serine protease n=1 Tax=Paludisphaera rhizosphaerae TaxID=2711216 RepID=UPI0013EAE85C|nr:trypsin-like peptidase domain-containing protein [Paludisphaera rhizosphaerae]